MDDVIISSYFIIFVWERERVLLLYCLNDIFLQHCNLDTLPDYSLGKCVCDRKKLKWGDKFMCVDYRRPSQRCEPGQYLELQDKSKYKNIYYKCHPCKYLTYMKDEYHSPPKQFVKWTLEIYCINIEFIIL